MKEFTNVYPVSKTLRFELKPVGRTLEFIEKNGIIADDNHRAESYKTIKGLIDDYHKEFIDDALSNYVIPIDDLEKYYSLYTSSQRDDNDEKQFNDIKKKLRKQLIQHVKNFDNKRFEKLFKKEMITEELVNRYKDEQDKLDVINEFSKFTTYFTGFYQNRKNIYSDEEISTSIAYRLVHQNIPKYIDNIKIFNRITETGIDSFLPELESKLIDRIGDSSISIKKYFSLNGVNLILTQKGIDIYNSILGAFFNDDESEKVKGINEYINLYNQKQKDKSKRIPQMKQLYKQILSDRLSSSFTMNKFEYDHDVYQAIDEYSSAMFEDILDNAEFINLEELIESIDSYNLSKIYIKNDSSITTISESLYKDWSKINNCISDDYDSKHNYKSTEKYYEKRKADLKKIKYYSISDLNEFTSDNIQKYYVDGIGEYIKNIRECYKEYVSIVKPGVDKATKNLINKNKSEVDKIKNYLDSIKALQNFVKSLIVDDSISDKDEHFYGRLTRIWTVLDKINPIYNKVRNYITQKPYSDEKIKINFNRSTVLDGWDKNKEEANLGVILLKDDLYYLAIMDCKSNKSFSNTPQSVSNDKFRKMNYKLLPDPSKMLPKVFFSKSRIDEFGPSKELLEAYNKGTHKKGDNFKIEDCHRLIDFYKDSIAKHEDWNKFNFHFSDTSSYNDLSDFYKEVSDQGYKITFQDVDADYINNLVDEGKLYLFQIYNKDFSTFSKGKPNLHTMYWKALFSDENLHNVVYKLNGQAEVFFRKKSIALKVTHKANEPIKNKYPNAKKTESVFDYDLIKDKRYAFDKFQFHVPITMNFKAPGENRFNNKVNRFIHDNDVFVIGIDRGERNLLYITVIDNKGNIVEQKSLNKIISVNNDNISHDVDYHMLLDKREKDNLTSRQSWSTINTIKELKEGYLSQVVHELSKLMVKYNAIIVLESLNSGFMRGRQKVEKQVYQKFEKMLIDKLNYLVFKDIPEGETGGLLNAYQFTDRFDSFQKLGMQSGFLFYIPAWMTSKIDPSTGFVNLLNTKYKSVEESKQFINKFNSIRFNKADDYFEFSLDYSNFTFKADGSKTDWILCSYGTRIINYRDKDNNNTWSTKEINLTDEFKNLFMKYDIDYNSDDLIGDINNIQSADFYKSFLDTIGNMLQLRNSDSERNIDEIKSPVKNDYGVFFNSSDSEYYNNTIPLDADANGSYNIARKGLMLIQRIKETPIDELQKVKLAISNKDWLKFAQENTI